MEHLPAKVLESDIVVYATPLYVDNVSGIMKNFMDRCIPLADPHFEKDESGETRHVERHKRKHKIVVISNCGYPEQEQFQALGLLFRRIARNEHSELIAEIYRGEGPLLQINDKELEPIIQVYKETLKKAGREVVKNLKLSEETSTELEKPLIPYNEYVKLINRHMDENLP